jgi:maltose alpha-D-glucosyltransferase/alpha-amylase
MAARKSLHRRLEAIEPRWSALTGMHLYLPSLLDGNGDGIGDLAGLHQTLDYYAYLGQGEGTGTRRHQRPGIDTLMTGPITAFDPNGKDGPYGVTNYRDVAPEYGSLALLKAVSRDARARGMGLVMDGVFNHTSDRHPWFQEALRDPSSPYRSYYTFGTDEEMRRQYGTKRPLFPDAHATPWSRHPDDAAGLNYLHTFYGGQGGQPDLAVANPRVRDELTDVLRFMFRELKAVGVRLDGVTFYDAEPGTNGETRPRALALVEGWARMMEREFPGTYLLAETNQRLETQARWLKAAHSAYNFHLMNAIWRAFIERQWAPVIELLELLAVLDPDGRFSNFLRNHDELTLEMASEEDRELFNGYWGGRRGKYRVNYGLRQRAADLVNGNEQVIRLLHLLLMAMPGKPWIYAGDEFGSHGSRDLEVRDPRDAVRTPHQWSDGPNAGFSRGPSDRLFLPVAADARTNNVRRQAGVQGSLLEGMRQIIALRRDEVALQSGELEILKTDNPAVLALARRHPDGDVLVVLSLSPTGVPVNVDLGARFGSVRWWDPLGQREVGWFGVRSEQRLDLDPFGSLVLLPFRG